MTIESVGEDHGVSKTDVSITPNNNKYSMSGNDIIVHSLDLNREFSEIREELNRIADYL